MTKYSLHSRHQQHSLTPDNFACLRCAAADTTCPHEPPFERLICPNFGNFITKRENTDIIKIKRSPFCILDARITFLVCTRTRSRVSWKPTDSAFSQ